MGRLQDIFNLTEGLCSGTDCSVCTSLWCTYKEESEYCPNCGEVIEGKTIHFNGEDLCEACAECLMEE